MWIFSISTSGISGYLAAAASAGKHAPGDCPGRLLSYFINRTHTSTPQASLRRAMFLRVSLAVMLALPPCYAQPASMLNCPAGVTTALLKDNCVKTTSTRCGDGGSKGEMCKSLLALANEKDGCVRGLLDEGAKRYGLSDKQACFWSPACGIDPANLNGANCISALPNPKPTSKKSMTNFKTKVVAQSITDFCENDFIG